MQIAPKGPKEVVAPGQYMVNSSYRGETPSQDLPKTPCIHVTLKKATLYNPNAPLRSAALTCIQCNKKDVAVLATSKGWMCADCYKEHHHIHDPVRPPKAQHFMHE